MPKCRRGKVVENKVGRRYRRAGYNVKLRRKTSAGEIDVFATRRSERIAVEVKHGNKKRLISSGDVKKVAKKAKVAKAKPVLILSGKAEATLPAIKTARDLGVRIKRL